MFSMNRATELVQHYMWAGGHFVLLISALRYLLATVLFRGPSPWWYKSTWALSHRVVRK